MFFLKYFELLVLLGVGKWLYVANGSDLLGDVVGGDEQFLGLVVHLAWTDLVFGELFSFLYSFYFFSV